MCIHRKTLLIKINTKLIAKKEQVVEWVKIKDKFASRRRLDRKIWNGVKKTKNTHVFVCSVMNV